jgi:hypothetical protein
LKPRSTSTACSISASCNKETHHEHDEQQEFGSANLLASGQTLKQHRDAIIERTRPAGTTTG